MSATLQVSKMARSVREARSISRPRSFGRSTGAFEVSGLGLAMLVLRMLQFAGDRLSLFSARLSMGWSCHEYGSAKGLGA